MNPSNKRFLSKRVGYLALYTAIVSFFFAGVFSVVGGLLEKQRLVKEKNRVVLAEELDRQIAAVAESRKATVEKWNSLVLAEMLPSLEIEYEVEAVPLAQRILISKLPEVCESWFLSGPNSDATVGNLNNDRRLLRWLTPSAYIYIYKYDFAEAKNLFDFRDEDGLLNMEGRTIMFHPRYDLDKDHWYIQCVQAKKQ